MRCLPAGSAVVVNVATPFASKSAVPNSARGFCARVLADDLVLFAAPLKRVEVSIGSVPPGHTCSGV